MDRTSLPESRVRHSRRDSTRAITATPENVAQVAAFLSLDDEQAEAAHRALDGEPMRRVMGIVDWLLAHERDADYSPKDMLLGWARNRQAGCYAPTPAERTWSGNSPEQDREIEEAVDTGGRSLPRSGWGVRFSNEQVEANLRRMSG